MGDVDTKLEKVPLGSNCILADRLFNAGQQLRHSMLEEALEQLQDIWVELYTLVHGPNHSEIQRLHEENKELKLQLAKYILTEADPTTTLVSGYISAMRYDVLDTDTLSPSYRAYIESPSYRAYIEIHSQGEYWLITKNPEIISTLREVAFPRSGDDRESLKAKLIECAVTLENRMIRSIWMGGLLMFKTEY